MDAAPGLTIIVNSSDGFEDCWTPFFTLLERYWPDCPQPILLNTGRKSWTYSALDVRCTQIELGHVGPMTWSECLLGALQQVTTPLVLYMQEDYFLEQPVDAALIADLARGMLVDPSIHHIGLTDFGSSGSFTPTDDPRLWRIGPHARYRISTQAGIWRVRTLASHLRSWENGWMFEIFGTLRARRRAETFLTVNRELYAGAAAVMQYLHTGIIKGQWHPDIPPVFARHGIQVDYRARGFHRMQPALLRRLDLLCKIAMHPRYVVKSLLR